MTTRLPLALLAALLASCLLAPPAQAAVCGSHQTSYAAFFGHRIVATYRVCHTRKGYRSVPRQRLTSVSRPRITLPTRIPTGAGETVKVSRSPYLFRRSSNLWEYRFSIKQGHVLTPATSSYDFKLQVRSRFLSSLSAPVGRICFVGHACSDWNG